MLVTSYTKNVVFVAFGLNTETRSKERQTDGRGNCAKVTYQGVERGNGQKVEEEREKQRGKRKENYEKGGVLEDL